MVEEWFERNDHPLLNDLILNKVLEYVRPADLKACRVACKKWNMSTIAFTRKAWLVTIHGSDHVESKLEMSLRDPHWIGKFVKVFSLNELGIPFTRFRLGAICMTDAVGQQFLTLCGDIIQEINQSIHYDAYMVEDVSELLRSTPNLVRFRIPKHLHSMSSNIIKLFPGPENSKPKLPFLKQMKSFEVSLERRNEFCPSFMEELFVAAKNITHLFISNSHIDENSESGTNCSSVEMLSSIEKLGRESCIETLHFFSDLKAKHVDILRRMESNGMKLKGIHAHYNSNQCIEVAKIFKDTLRVLRAESFNISLMEFPEMTHLTSLTTYISNEFEFFNLSNIFSSLKKLDAALQFQCSKEYDEFFSESDPCLRMKSLRFHSTSVKITGFSRTLTLFPNLTELHLDLEMHGLVLRNIWTQMTHLEVFTLTGSIDTKGDLDSIFTGISTRSLQEIEQFVNGLGEMTGEVRAETISKLRNQYSLLPSIANLSNLRHLELNVISSNDNHIATYLTDLTRYLNFYAMHILRHLDVGPSRLTKCCCEILTTDLGLQSWTFLDVDRGNIIPSVPY